MTNPNNAIGTNAAYSGRTSAKAFNDVLGAFTPGIVSGWECQVDSGMTVLLGGDGVNRDVAVAVNNTGDKTSINNISADEVAITIAAAPAADTRIDAIVAYVDNPPQGSSTSADNPEACGLIAVQGTSAADPEEPSENIIRSAITADGASGTTAYYVVLATVTVATGTTDLTNDDITQGEKSQLIIMSDASNITMTNVDPGEGVALAPNHFIGVYSENPTAPIVLDYSLTEVDTGYTWTDGSPIYKKTIDFGALPNNGNKYVPHGITNLGQMVEIKGVGIQTTGENPATLPIPHFSFTSGASVEIYTNLNNVFITTGMDRSNVNGYVTLYYTKSS